MVDPNPMVKPRRLYAVGGAIFNVYGDYIFCRLYFEEAFLSYPRDRGDALRIVVKLLWVCLIPSLL